MVADKVNLADNAKNDTALTIVASIGGNEYPWSDARVFVSIVIGGLLFTTFFGYEYLLEPGKLFARKFPKVSSMLPLSLFHKKDTTLLTIVALSSGASLYAAFYFISIYWNVAMSDSPSEAGIQLLYYLPGLGVGTVLAMFLCNAYPRQTSHPLLASAIIEAAGMAVLPWAVTARNGAVVNGMMALAGCGTGLRFMLSGLHNVGIWPLRLAAAISLTDFTNEFGGTLSIAIMGTVFNSKWSQYLSDIPSTTLGGAGENLSPRDTQSLGAINALPLDLQNPVRQAAAKAVMWAFISILPIIALRIISSIGLGNVWINATTSNEDETVDEMSKGWVMYDSFLLAAWRRDVKVRKVAKLQARLRNDIADENNATRQEERRTQAV
ncbi:hypothetical protein W97_05579 [Coniosporium apollinis CBS 100218]|uniref:Major facilitator superfamily (MFS) profile domain-containing protein n=1 Tax=Coniosporium apollinis (strain CBS 100218) TaxID=1168221 RepID=R7YXT2_CONA1|nr:uncharacterized protein W97_05579 [Coniosporium apollinis CBS 100218]EON66481.1 hypothetical protein W97_05579 [Coniosporium apollinis CBS 100218]